MSDVSCKHCNSRVVPGTEHHCAAMQRAGIPPAKVPKTPDEGSKSCFITSAVIASATDSAVVGTILGGDPVGAIVGEALGSHDDVATDQPANDEATTESEENTDTSDETDEDDEPDDDD